MTVSIFQILNTQYNGFVDTTTIKKSLEDQVAKSQTKNVYSSVSELKNSGLSEQFNNLKKGLINNARYDISVTIASNRNTKEFGALNAIMDALVDLNASTANLAHGGPTLAQKADIALQSIQTALNTIGNNGERIFGGIDSNTDPCGDLTAASNIVAGKIITNYTSAVPNEKTIQLSDFHKLSVGIAASDKTFAEIIAAVNTLKVADNPNSIRAAQPLMSRAKADLEWLIAKNGVNKNIIDQARDYNGDQKVAINKQLSDNFTLDEAESATDIQACYELVLAGYAYNRKLMQLSNELFTMLSR